MPQPQVEYPAAGPVHDERQQDDGQDYHDHPEEEHDDAGMAYPATVLALATATSYPPPPDLFGGCSGKARWPLIGRAGSRPAGSEAWSRRRSLRPVASDEVRR